MNKQDIINALQDHIFDDPGKAIGNDGWMLYKDYKRTRQRPDGSDGGRNDQMTVRRLASGRIYIGYNGAQYQGGELFTYFGRAWNTGDTASIAERLADIYGIPFNREDWGRGGAAHGKLDDELDIITIPPSIPRVTFGRTNMLQLALETWIDPVIVAGTFYEYGIGTTKDGRTIFWQYDRLGRCRTGKIMRYDSEGKRDRVSKDGCFFAHDPLIRAGLFPKGWKPVQAVFGEHLLAIHPTKPVAVVESEKTALILNCFCPGIVWLATGGKENTGRVAALLDGRAATFWPDADAVKDWKKTFNHPGWKVEDRLQEELLKIGPKSDLADLLERQSREGVLNKK